MAVALVAAATGWLLTSLLVADDSTEALLALVAWLLAGAALGYVTWRWLDAARRLDAVREGSTDAILRVDGKGTIVDWSPGAQELYGYDSDEAVGLAFAELCAEPDSADLILERVRSREFLADDIGQRRADDSTFKALVRVIPGAGEATVVVRDVGEVRRVTGQLRDVEATYRSLREHLPVVTYIRSLDGETTFVSPQIDRLAGYTPDEWLSDAGLFLRLVHEEDRAAVAAAYEAVDAATPLRTSYRLRARDGRTVWVRDEAAVVLDAAGAPLCIQGYLLDVSDRKTAVEERRELRAAEAATAERARGRQRRIDFVAEAASVLASSLDVSANVAEVAELAARDMSEWCVVDVLEDDGSVTRYAAARSESPQLAAGPHAHPEQDVLDVMQDGRPALTATHMRIPLVTRGRRTVGALTFAAGEHAAEFVADDLPWGRAVAGMIALAIDNSRLQTEVEARSEADKVLTHVGDGVFLVDGGGVIRLWNPASAMITGVSAETAVGKPASDAIPGWHDMAERIPVATPTEPTEAAALPLDTERGERWLSISGVDFFGGTVYAFRDITEEHRLDELKTEFIATASHELRTPLAAVYGAAQTLKRHDFALDEGGRERFVSLIVDESNRLAQIVNQILLANQLDVGRLDLETEPFDAADLVERVVASAKTHAPAHISFDIQVAEPIPPVAADKDRAQQVLVNLVENAVKYSPGGGRVELGVEAVDGAVQFRVVDEGLGIPADEQRRIFEKFYRLDPNMTKGIGGTGLGLYICSELVERMGGQIWLESEEGKGSAFFFELPSAGSGSATPRARETADVTGHGLSRRR